MLNKLQILRTGVVVYFLIYLLVFSLSIFYPSYSIISSAMTLVYGLLLIIFRKEAIIILDEHEERFKAKHPRLRRLYNPGVLALLIAGAASSWLWFSLIGIWAAYVEIGVFKALRVSLALNGPVFRYATAMPFALVSAALFVFPFVLVVRRNLLLSTAIFMFSFLLTYIALPVVLWPSMFEFSYRQRLSLLLAYDDELWFFIAFFVLFALLGAPLRRRSGNLGQT